MVREIYEKMQEAFLFNTGKEPGIPVHTGHVCEFGAPPNSVEQEQKIFVLVANST